MKKYSKALATIPGGLLGISISEALEPVFYDVFEGLISPVEPYVLLAQAVVLIAVVGISVYASPKNEE